MRLTVGSSGVDSFKGRNKINPCRNRDVSEWLHVFQLPGRILLSLLATMVLWGRKLFPSKHALKGVYIPAVGNNNIKLMAFGRSSRVLLKL